MSNQFTNDPVVLESILEKTIRHWKWDEADALAANLRGVEVSSFKLTGRGLRLVKKFWNKYNEGLEQRNSL